MPAIFLVAGMARSYTWKITVVFNRHWNKLLSQRESPAIPGFFIESISMPTH